MISTLIRSRQDTTPPQMGNSEYLVNTENNRIIYPYTLAENILSKDNQGNIILPDGNNKPIFGGSGIDPNTFIHKSFDLAGIKTPAMYSNKIINEYMPNVSGIYILNTWFNQNGLTPVPTVNTIKSIYVKASNNTPVSQYVNDAFGGYIRALFSFLIKIDETSIIEVGYENVVDNTIRTFGTHSVLEYKLIKLCDL